MSACISHHGEYSSHEPGDDFRCQFCGVLDEDALIERVKRAEAVIAEVKRLAELDVRCPCCTGYENILDTLTTRDATRRELSNEAMH